MNRKLLVVVAVAAVLALLAGAAVGRNLLSDATPTPRTEVIRFKDTVAKVSIAYPATWRRLHRDDDADVALIAAAPPDSATSLLMRVSASGLTAPVTVKTLPIVRKYTDGLVSADARASQLFEPVAVTAGGLPGWRYRYTYGSGASGGAHDHYFLFKGERMIQLVFQAVPAERLLAVAPVFDSIAGSFRGSDA